MSDEIAELRKEVAAIARRLDALHADVQRVIGTAVRFGRDIELRERGWL
jgi:tetrahydromethanopterin S-methyltransferase subunit G